MVKKPGTKVSGFLLAANTSYTDYSTAPFMMTGIFARYLIIAIAIIQFTNASIAYRFEKWLGGLSTIVPFRIFPYIPYT